MTVTALVLAALLCRCWGCCPHGLAEPVAALAPSLCGRASLWPRRSLPGLGKSQGRGHFLTIGMAVYFLFIRLVLMDRKARRPCIWSAGPGG